MADNVFKPEALVPIWYGNTGISALDKFAQRPVLVEVESLGNAMYGQILELTMSEANVLPDSLFLIWKSIHVKVSFRYGDVVYALTGITTVSEADRSFRFKFDSVTRKSLMILGKNLGDAGLLDSADVEQILATKDAEATAAEVDSASVGNKRSHTARLVRHEKPPGGRERRVHHRYDIDVDAKLAIVNTDYNLGCKVMELSLGGCRVYTDLPNNIEMERHLEVQFIECGFPLRMPAKVQVKNGGHILGLRFLELSSRMRERLKSLIWEIAEKEMGH
jgi:hypothetical protein